MWFLYIINEIAIRKIYQCILEVLNLAYILYRKIILKCKMVFRKPKGEVWATCETH